MKDTAETSEKQPKRMIANELANISAITKVNVSPSENLGGTIRHQRNDRHQLHNPEIRTEIPVLSLVYQLSVNGEQVLLFDSGHSNDDRILIFGTDQAVQRFARLVEWSAMGLSALAHKYFSSCIPFMLEIIAKRFPIFLPCCLVKQGKYTTDLFGDTKP